MLVGLNGPVGRSGRDLGGGVSLGGCRLSSPPLSGSGMGRTSGCQGALRFREVGVRVWAIRLSRTIRGHTWSLGRGTIKISSGRGRENISQGMGSIRDENYLSPDFFAKTL